MQAISSSMNVEDCAAHHHFERESRYSCPGNPGVHEVAEHMERKAANILK